MINKYKNNIIMDEILRDLLVSLAAIGAIFTILYVTLMTRYKERMSLMEKGLSPREFSNTNAGWVEKPGYFQAWKDA